MNIYKTFVEFYFMRTASYNLIQEYLFLHWALNYSHTIIDMHIDTVNVYNIM